MSTTIAMNADITHLESEPILDFLDAWENMR